MAPSNGSRVPVSHSAYAGVVNRSDPRRFYPFCSANDFEANEEYETAELAKADTEMQAHLRDQALTAAEAVGTLPPPAGDAEGSDPLDRQQS